MAKKNRIGIIGAGAIALATALGGAHQANALVPVEKNIQQNKKEALPERQNSVKPQATKNKNNIFSGESNPYKHKRKDYRNQRQYRKWKRSNPNV